MSSLTHGQDINLGLSEDGRGLRDVLLLGSSRPSPNLIFLSPLLSFLLADAHHANF